MLWRAKALSELRVNNYPMQVKETAANGVELELLALEISGARHVTADESRL
jgi:hypothetical protein